MQTRFPVARALGLAISLALLAGRGMAAEINGPTREVFNGKDFTGWKVLGCEAEIQDGCIFLKAGNGLVQLDGQYDDFILELDWKALKPDNWDSGIYIRYTSVPKGRPWPKMYQSNLRKGIEGNIAELPGTMSKGLVKDHQWNHFKLTVQGTTVALEINGQPAWKVDGLKVPKGYIGLQAEVPNGGQFLFRNIRLATPK